jgi:tetratricopeptide (TPR) repeat protein
VFFQQDYDHATKLWLKSLAIDPDFPAALNMLGYVYVEGDEPDPAKAVDYLRHYAAVQPDQANPQDSLGEVLRIAGDDGGSLAHYAESLRIDPKMITSQYGRGDTYALMGDWMKANTEYKKALQLSMNVRDTQHILFQSAMLHFWIGDVAGGREALAMLSEKVTEANNASAQFEIDYARAILAPDLATEHRLLQSLEGSLAEVRPGILESDRNSALASVLREEIRVAVAANQPQDASAAALKLQQLAESSRNQLIENVYESALGYVSLGGGDYAKAAQQLSADLHSPQVLRDYLRAQEKLADTKSLDTARRRLQYLRAPTADWFLVSHDTTLTSQQVAP